MESGLRRTAHPFRIIRTSSDVELDPSSTSLTKIVICEISQLESPRDDWIDFLT